MADDLFTVTTDFGVEEHTFEVSEKVAVAVQLSETLDVTIENESSLQPAGYLALVDGGTPYGTEENG